MAKKRTPTAKNTSPIIPEEALLKELSLLIEKSKQRAVSQVKSTVTMLFWQVGKRINEEILHNKRAAYGAQIIASLAERLSAKYGRSFELRNLRRMMQFASEFPNKKIVSTVSTQLGWSHIIELLPLQTIEAKMFYANEAKEQGFGVRELRKSIATKTFERTKIANTQISKRSKIPYNTFKDPYMFDFFNLQNAYLEKDVETAILYDLESFILELGKGFTFVERQKRMIIDNEDFYLDLLFYHRKQKRLVAVELKLGKFNAKYQGQMKLYLKWLNRYERQADENEPIGLILCAGDSREQIELLEMHKDGIMVAEYWTELPPKKDLEEKIHNLLLEARERLEARKLLGVHG
ncbi:MAG: PDDEXK nuclease domain-containing protein [Treponema sp.]|jgi:predicted nuclease of restriction endonuclease-like (RecB) superfamily|nr:PDDEXK nuclease domain-containing protein [Treponema sp.]